MKTMKWLVVLAAAVLLATVCVISAAADGPDYRDTLVWETDETRDDLCSFPVLIHFDYEIKIMEWYDENGGFLKGHQSWGQVRAIITKEGSIQQLEINAKGPVHGTMLDTGELELKSTGPNGFVVVPGYGPALGTSGMAIFHIQPDWSWEFVRSSHQFEYDEEDRQAFCDYLAGD